jgi:hypothetical protein
MWLGFGTVVPSARMPRATAATQVTGWPSRIPARCRMPTPEQFAAMTLPAP